MVTKPYSTCDRRLLVLSTWGDFAARADTSSKASISLQRARRIFEVSCLTGVRYYYRSDYVWREGRRQAAIFPVAYHEVPVN